MICPPLCCRSATGLFKASNHLDVQFANLFAERVSVQPQELGRLDLISTGRRQGQLHQRTLDLTDHAAVQALGRKATLVGGEVGLEMAFDRAAQGVVVDFGCDLRDLLLGQFGLQLPRR